MRKIWTATEIEILTSLYPHYLTEYVATVLVIDPKKVYAKANQLGIKKTKEFLKTDASGRNNVLKSSGVSFRFPKGNTPWNKGIKGIQLGGVETQFKKGSEPHNTKSDGAISIREDKGGRKYYWIRKSKANWSMLHVDLWEREKGPIPSGLIVRFKDGNTLNCVLENLELISRREHMLKNSIQRYPEEVKSAMRTIGKLKRTINKITDEK